MKESENLDFLDGLDEIDLGFKKSLANKVIYPVIQFTEEEFSQVENFALEKGYSKSVVCGIAVKKKVQEIVSERKQK